MEEYQTEEQQVEALKRWWQENARSVLTGVALALVIVFGVRGWFDYQAKQVEKASALFAEVQKEAGQNKAEGPAKQLSDEFPASTYTVLAAFELAEQAVKGGDFARAESELRRAVERATLPELKQLAKVRLARVLVAANRPQEAIDQLGGDLGKFQPMAEEARGDALLALGKKADARAAYEKALAGYADLPSKQQLLQMKVDDLAGVNS